MDILKTNLKIWARARGAERLLRESLAIQQRGAETDHWRTDERRSRLGSALVSVAVTDPALTHQARVAIFAEAEPLLLEGHAAMQQGEGINGRYKRDCHIRLVRLYEAWDKPGKAAEWQQKLANFDKTAAENKTAGEVEPPAK